MYKYWTYNIYEYFILPFKPVCNCLESSCAIFIGLDISRTRIKYKKIIWSIYLVTLYIKE